MNYAEARDRIRTGDLIAVRKKTGVLPVLTRLVTRSPYTHTAIALWSGVGEFRRLLVAEAKASGAFLTPLSQYADTDFDVWEGPREIQLSIERVIWATLGAAMTYDGADLFRIALNRLLGVPLPPADNALKICSALSATLWMQAGWRPRYLPSLPAPDDVVAALAVPPFLEIRPVIHSRSRS